MSSEQREVTGPMKQKVWGWPAVANAVFGGTAAGFYVINFFTQTFIAGAAGGLSYYIAGLLPLVLIGLGFLSLTEEAGRPAKGYYLVLNLRRSWMSAEVLSGIIFIILSSVYLLFSNEIIGGAAAAAAGGFILCQGLIFSRACAVTAWNVPVIPLFFVTSGLFMGAGLALLLAGITHVGVGGNLLAVAVTMAVLDLAVWIAYVYIGGGPAFRRATEAIRRPLAMGITAGIGHLVPLVLLSVLLLPSLYEKIFAFRHVLLLLSGLAIVVGGVWQKKSMVLEADYLRGIRMGAPEYHGTSPQSSLPHKSANE